MKIEEIKDHYSRAETAHKEIREGGDSFPWDERENLFFGRYKNQKENTRSILSTGELTTLNIDRASRVMAQLPNGKFHNLNGKTGANMCMNLIFEHYVFPNAKRGGTMLQKLRAIDLYSGVFGTMPVFIDWVFSNKYVGPELVMLHPRRAKPQAGKNSVEEMEIFFVDVEVSKRWLEEKLEMDFWNKEEVQKVLDEHKDFEGEGSPIEERSPEERNHKKTGITLRHCFSKDGDWIVYEPTTDAVLVAVEQYYDEIPIATKIQYPKLDSFWAYSDFERGELTQKSIDTLVRMYLDGIEESINPPKKIDPKGVILSSLKTKEWFVKNGAMNSIEMVNTSPTGMQTFQSTYQILKANLLSLGASSDTSISKSTDVGFGKTPEALRQQGERQGARDAWDSLMMKEFIEDAFTKMANLLAKKGVDDIAFELLGTSIEKIKERYPDEDYSLLGEHFEDGKVSINPEYIRGEYRYIMDEGSTMMKKDDTGQKLIGLMQLYLQNPQIQEDLAQRGQRFDFGEAFKRILIDQGVQDSEKIIITEDNPEGVEGIEDDGSNVMPPDDLPEPPEGNPLADMPPQPSGMPQQAPQASQAPQAQQQPIM